MLQELNNKTLPKWATPDVRAVLHKLASQEISWLNGIGLWPKNNRNYNLKKCKNVYKNIYNVFILNKYFFD
jgi:hypothetical protein